MLTLERQEEILEILNRNKSATVEELASELFVSGATIRRDLRSMEKQGLIKRSHGGAMPFKSSAEESAFAIREQENISAKRTIANLAVKLINNGTPGQVVFAMEETLPTGTNRHVFATVHIKKQVPEKGKKWLFTISEAIEKNIEDKLAEEIISDYGHSITRASLFVENGKLTVACM